jgi:hypothetical protein
MIQLAPIDSSVQKTLEKKERTLSNKKPGQIEDDIFGLKSEINDSYTGLAVRSTFIKMTSLVGNKFVVIQGGELLESETYPFQNEMAGGLTTKDLHSNTLGTIYGPIRDKNSQKKTANMYYRPISGLKNIDVQYKGGLKALREGNISWTCYNFEDLERLTPHFLWHGKNILIEWGWSYPNLDTTSEWFPRTFNLNTYLQSDNVEAELVKHIKKQRGNYDAMLGTITNYEYSSRDDGGFDCNTKIISRGANLFKNTLPPIEQKVLVSTEQGDNKKTIVENYINFKSYLKTLGQQLKFVKGQHQEVLTDADTEEEVKSYSILYENKNGVEMGPYCTLGYFEDNILSRFFGFVSDDKTLFEFRSIEQDTDGVWHSTQIANHNLLFTAHPDTHASDDNALIIPGQFPYGIENVSYDAKNENLTVGTGKTRTYSGGAVIEGTKKVAVTENYIKLKNKTMEFEKFAVPGTNNKKGYVRNLLLHYKLIEDAFEDADTLESGMSKLFSNINAHYGNFWNFELSASEGGKRMKIIDKNITHTDAIDFIETNNSKNKEYNTELKLLQKKYNYDGMYIFPVWEEGSLVKSQNFTAKLPDKMALGALYGSGNKFPKKTEETNVQNFSTNEGAGDTAAQVFARLFNPNYDEDATIYKDALNNNISLPYQDNKSFGNLKALPNEPLSVGPSKTETIKNGGHKIDVAAIVNTDSTLAIIKDIDETYEEGEGDLSILFENSESTTTEEEVESNKTGGVVDSEIAKAFPEFVGFDPMNSIQPVTVTVTAESTGITPDISHLDVEERDAIYGDKDAMEKYGTRDVKWYGKGGALRKEYQKNMFEKIKNDEKGIHNTIDPLLNIELELEIDGTGGIFPGNVFHSSYLPRKIRKSTVYQAMDVNHRVDSSFWSTTIRGQMRYAGTKVLEKQRDAIAKIEEMIANPESILLNTLTKDSDGKTLNPDIKGVQKRKPELRGKPPTLKELSGAGSPIQRVGSG